MRNTDSASEETVSKESTIDFLLVSRADSVSQSECVSLYAKTV